LIAGDVGLVFTVIVEIKWTNDANKADNESLRQENLLQHLLNLRILAEAEHTKNKRKSTKDKHEKRDSGDSPRLTTSPTDVQAAG
jgi:hypothetical protein